jgi:peptide deformylase
MPPIRLFPDAALREKSSPVSQIDDGIRRLIRNLVSAMHEQPDGVGLAAPQLGVPLRVFVFDVGDGPKALINPVIETADGWEERLEGCLSIPGLYYPVERPSRVVVAGVDEDGQRVRFEMTGLGARVVQHETDHLDGILFFDRLVSELQAEAKRILRERLLAIAS